ncbi:MAG: DUF4199 domain-containing protein [Prevotella sp.]|nr:DUF4199 domain-containing protein [Prevotella sp.]
MTGIEYIQLKAFARIDGALLALVLVGCFVCYLLGMQAPLYGIGAMALAVSVPFLVGWRLKRFRDKGLDGQISFLRGLGYVVFVFFYGGLLFALAQYAYFAYLDGGYLANMLTEMMSQPENSEMLRQLGMTQQIDESLELMRQMRPIDLSLQGLTMLLMIGPLVGIPVAALLKRELKKN